MRLHRVMVSALVIIAPTTARAQFYSYPSFQPPSVSSREFNFAVVEAGEAGTSLLFQWRESAGTRTHLQFDAGLADPDGASGARLVIGGGGAYRLRSADAEIPLDVVLTAGLGGSFGDGTSLIRIPVGVSVGHTFRLDVPMALTPYVHPRLAIDRCSKCGSGGDASTRVSLDVDFGASFEVNRSLSLRASVLMSGSEMAGRDDAFGISAAWNPPGLR